MSIEDESRDTLEFFLKVLAAGILVAFAVLTIKFSHEEREALKARVELLENPIAEVPPL